MAASLKAIEAAPLPPIRVKPLNFDEPTPEVPSTHTWPSSYVDNHPVDSISIPVIDLANVGQKELDLLRHACEEFGFFHILNHGVPNKIIEDFKEEMIKLFSLPMEAKLRALRTEKDTSGYGGVPISRFSPNCMWHEGFAIRDQLYEHAAKIWPPNGNPKFCQVIEDYQAAMKTLAEKLLTHVLASIGLTPGDTNWSEPKTNENPFGIHSTHLQLNSYPQCPDPSKAMALAQHTDASILTFVNQVNGTTGLQVLHDDKWVKVDPVPGAFVVNVGDLAHFITNGRFVSPVHRVIPLKDDHRYSAAYFYGPPREAMLTPLPKLIGPDRPQIYRPFTWKDYLNAKTKYDRKVFEFMRIDWVDDSENIEGE